MLVLRGFGCMGLGRARACVVASPHDPKTIVSNMLAHDRRCGAAEKHLEADIMTQPEPTGATSPDLQQRHKLGSVCSLSPQQLQQVRA